MTHDELVGAMQHAIWEIAGMRISDDAMSAAAGVCVDACLEMPTREEANAAAPSVHDMGTENATHLAYATRFINRRRARLAQRPKTPEERVTVERMGASEHVFVLLDGADEFQFDGEDEAVKHAKRYRLGLIAELKERGE